MGKQCERCGAKSPNPNAGPYALFDYCAECSSDLCDRCMAEGCCDHVPAKSGNDEAEAAWDSQQERLMESGGPDDSAYRRDMIAAGRGHLLR